MTLVRRCTEALPVLFWQLVCVGVLGYSGMFLFYTDESRKLFEDPVPSDKVIQYMGVAYLLVAAGFNQLIVSMLDGGAMLMRMASAVTHLFYILAGSAVITLYVKEEMPFVKFQNEVVFGVSVAFTSVVALGLLLTLTGSVSMLSGCCARQTAPVAELETVVTGRKVAGRVPNSRAEILAAAGRL